MNKIFSFISLVRLNKPIGIFLLLWPTLWALWLLSNGVPNLRVLGIFVLGVILTRSLGCAINDLVDRKIDAKVSRTKNRPLALKLISIHEAFYLIIILVIFSLALVFQLNIYAIKIASIALILIILYPFTKRFLPIPQAFLGITFGFSILMVSVSVQSQITLEAWLLFVANAFWVLAYDTHYAVADMKDDMKIKIKSAPLTFGKATMKIIASCYLVAFSVLILIGILSNYSFVYFIFLFIAFSIALNVWKKCILLESTANFNAFISNNYVGFLIFVGFLSQS
ncbi:MAG: 4-hydroxybenzoate octaprenyltransferase [Nitrosomonadales bacterium]|nr:4-hydroxybenzoate octaprenyltransferase [Nitrosomonadales bacterium]MBT3918316.1 4-hydroxybenzoate octaprenyltransferase [Nitrosomonadales bacterium]MBT4759359.1 4-hydroxybenzoate octaprenyltransferase [Nitrosomonadales bacterium]MBT5150699.1 4-hydroxybenzoate octaprenyltransferase [Nitrosomonadales bacterium]MBT5573217.1 4-hydroxybenzoate octaprenyltransferase [Nitrosomonadales bacterium]